MRRAAPAVVLTALLSCLPFAPPASALCGGLETPAQALAAGRVVFVGVVDSVSNLDRWAVVHVEEVWSSGDQPEWVEVRGTVYEPELFDIFANVSSGDRYYRPSERYLFSLEIRDGRLFDFECGATVPWDPSFGALRPETAHPPIPGSPPQPGIPWMLVGLGAVVLLASGALLALRRNARRRTTA